MNKTYKIYMKEFLEEGSKALAGRNMGEIKRKLINLEDLEKQNEIIEIIFPDDLLSLNTSFFLGFFTPSIRLLKKDGFLKKYIFTGPEKINSTIEKGIIRALKDASALEGDK